MNIEERVRILEEQVRGLISARAMDKFYTDADINGTRQSVANITPTVITERAYYGESEKTFYDAPMGNVSVFFSNYTGAYSVNRVSNRLIVSFDTLSEPTDITISIQ
jgi:hypothetical protein